MKRGQFPLVNQRRPTPNLPHWTTLGSDDGYDTISMGTAAPLTV